MVRRPEMGRDVSAFPCFVYLHTVGVLIIDLESTGIVDKAISPFFCLLLCLYFYINYHNIFIYLIHDLTAERLLIHNNAF